MAPKRKQDESNGSESVDKKQKQSHESFSIPDVPSEDGLNQLPQHAFGIEFLMHNNEVYRILAPRSASSAESKELTLMNWAILPFPQGAAKFTVGHLVDGMVAFVKGKEKQARLARLLRQGMFAHDKTGIPLGQVEPGQSLDEFLPIGSASNVLRFIEIGVEKNHQTRLTLYMDLPEVKQSAELHLPAQSFFTPPFAPTTDQTFELVLTQLLPPKEGETTLRQWLRRAHAWQFRNSRDKAAKWKSLQQLLLPCNHLFSLINGRIKLDCRPSLYVPINDLRLFEEVGPLDSSHKLRIVVCGSTSGQRTLAERVRAIESKLPFASVTVEINKDAYAINYLNPLKGVKTVVLYLVGPMSLENPLYHMKNMKTPEAAAGVMFVVNEHYFKDAKTPVFDKTKDWPETCATKQELIRQNVRKTYPNWIGSWGFMPSYDSPPPANWPSIEDQVALFLNRFARP